MDLYSPAEKQVIASNRRTDSLPSLSLARQPLAGKEGLDGLCYSSCDSGTLTQCGQIIMGMCKLYTISKLV